MVLIELTADLLKSLHLHDIQPLEPRYNIAPTQQVPVIRTIDNQRHLDHLKWGLIPSWAKDPSIGSKMINARAETVQEKPSFRTALKHRRCLVPVNGFYEWQHIEKQKIPYFVKLKGNDPMLFAGLWDHWKSPEGELIESFTIITTSNNELLEPIHNRMPVILHPSAYDTWLDPSVTSPEDLTPLLQPYPSGWMETYPVAHLVNISSKDGPDLIKPV